ncbi:uncharacterized protein ACHE_50415A [Aspergillus chevalieri]|uniref:Zn(2)-C6 fungal-type domain-containing protein n=2 Tax=Aspergillus chevalieri TaxID=182096 RepID=A0A7R7VR13_ASPCH|nr:uncharacterized protein ACHE_50415A [Aspergillus chevalieri]BCR89217.1 hypothetical protein ACHE_50415A [Aspergillus chevalieri]
MSSRVSKTKSSSVRKNELLRKISDNGFAMVFSCTRCARLGKTCVKSDDSDRCSECVKEGGRSRCVEMKPSYSDAEWRRLVRAQHSIKDEEEALLAKLLRLRKQERLLRERANEFISHEFQAIEELEELEREENRTHEEQGKFQKQGEDVECDAQLASVSNDPSLTQMMNSPSFWENFDSAVAGGIPSPTGGNQSSSQ